MLPVKSPYHSLAHILLQHQPNVVIDEMLFLLKEIYKINRAFFMPLAINGRALIYRQKDQGRTEELQFNILDFTHPFSHVAQHKKVKEIEQEEHLLWSNTNASYASLMKERCFYDGCLIVPFIVNGSFLFGVLVIDLVEFRNSKADSIFFRFIIQFISNHLTNVMNLKIREKESLYLNETIEQSRQEQILHKKRAEIKKRVVAHSVKMDEIVTALAKIASTDIAVLLIGETGTGKSEFAQLVHQHSLRKEFSFITINCSEFNHEALEKKLFSREGVFQKAFGGTVVLEEIGALSHTLQSRILATIENKRYQIYGETQYATFNSRIITSTQVNTKVLLKEGILRSDFYARISQCPIQLPPLGERMEELTGLVDFFIKEINEKSIVDKPIVGYEKDFIHMLKKQAWHGNLHELRNMLVTEATLSVNGILKSRSISDSLRSHSDKKLLDRSDLDLQLKYFPKVIIENQISLSQALIEIEKNVLIEGLREYQGQRKAVAKALKMPLRTLAYKCKKYNI